jgi:amino acid transporter
MILAAGSIANPAYVPTLYQTFLLTMLLMLTHGVISSMPTKWIALFNSYGSTFNIIALVIVVITIPAGTFNVPKFNSTKEVWGTIRNGTDYPDGVAVLLSFIGVIWTMSGYDSPFHLSEECSNANIASPRAIALTAGVGGMMGWFLQLVVAYTVVDINAVMNSDLNQPWAAYLLQVMPRKTALAILSLTIVCGFSMGQGCMIAASRVTYAYARDDCFPLSRIWKKVNRHTKTPVNAVWFNCTIGILMCLLIFAGPVATSALFSIGAIAAFVAFTIPIAIRTFFVGDRFRPGPWHLGKFGRPVGAMAVSFVALMLPILCLPSTTGANLT